MRRAAGLAAATVAVAVAVACGAAGCSRPLATARRTAAEPPAAIELAAAEQVRGRRCDAAWGLAFPGLSQLCLRQDQDAAIVGGLAVAELGTAVAVLEGTASDDDRVEDDAVHPGVALPLLGLQDLWVYGLAAGQITHGLANRRLYVPRDTLADLVAAPWNWRVLKRPEVWAGTLGFLAVGVGASLLVDRPDASRAGDDPDLFGHTFDRRVGYPLGFGVGVGLFTHVAIAEEALFRGVVQSSFARNAGETEGWLGASLLFGLIHAPNALLLPEEDRRDYLVYGLPVITAGGAYLGWLYRRTGYGLASPVAVHFWYDLLLTTTFFVLDPASSPFQAGVAIPF